MLSIAVGLESGKLPEEARWLYERVIELEHLLRARHDDAERHDGAREQMLTDENSWLREVIARVAQDLDRLASQPGRSDEAQDLLLARAALMRRQAQDGPPLGWRRSAPKQLDRTDTEAV